MAFIQWRRFNFFDRELLKDPTSGDPFDKLKEINVAVTTSGRGMILIGDTTGNLHLIDRSLQVSSFNLYQQRVTHLFQLRQHSVLISVGEDEEGTKPEVKVWNFDKLNRDGNPTCVNMIRADVDTNKAVAVTTIAVHENMSQMAIGFQDGHVVVLKGDITKTAARFKRRILHEDRYPINGLHYKQLGSNTILFVTTSETVSSYNVTAKDHKEQLEEFGAPLKCSAISDVSQENQFVIARPEALYFYQPEGRGPCLAFDSEKKMVTWFRGYLIVVSKEKNQMARPAGMGMSTLTVYDIDNKFIAYTAPFPEITDVVSEWGSLHVITTDGKIYHLEEKDTQTKLETLFRKNMYDMAISLAKSQHYSDGLVEIFRQYGDHLYSKGDHDGAIQQYMRTIGELEPSYVIRKFLDAQRIHNLTEYLQALHEKGHANTDHTTLLLNCYTKLKAVDKLNGFITTDKELNFDVETAIRVCRQAGYFKHALDLAEKFDQHNWYLSIQLEDVKGYRKALKYISKLPFDQAESNLKNYGKMLVNEVPEEATELLKTLCTDYIPEGDKPSEGQEIQMGRNIKKAKPDEFIHIFVHQKQKLKEFLEHMTKSRHDCSNVIYNTLLELYLHDASQALSEKKFVEGADQEKKALDLITNTESKYDLDHAMVLAQMHNFKRGILYLYEKAKSYQQILRYHMEHDEYDAIVQDCEKHGAKDPSLWGQALSYFAKKEEDCKKHIVQVLDHIDRCNLLSPLMVVQTLAHNSTATLSVVKDYIIKTLRHENEQIQKDERMIRQYRDDTEKMRNQIEELKTCAKIFQSSKCMICSRSLELPAIHFMCGDSFHNTCFESYADNENECPVCAPENRKVMDIIRTQEHNKDLHETFNHQLERSADGFSVVADYFGRGVFNKVTVYTDMSTQKLMTKERSTSGTRDELFQ